MGRLRHLEGNQQLNVWNTTDNVTILTHFNDLASCAEFLKSKQDSLLGIINKTDHHDITKILLKVALNTINLPLDCLSCPCTHYTYIISWMHILIRDLLIFIFLEKCVRRFSDDNFSNILIYYYIKSFLTYQYGDNIRFTDRLIVHTCLT